MPSQKSLLFFLSICCLLFIQSKCQQETRQESYEVQGDYAFTNVTVIPMTSNNVLPAQTVIVKDGKIEKIGSSEVLKPSENTTSIDASGKYLMPGISEMHAHIPVAQEGNDSLVKETLFLYLSNGITTIRGMLGDPYHLELREKVAGGEILSPRIYTSSPSLNGNSVTTPEEAIEKVTKYKEEGYDFLKIHPGIKLHVFESLVETAKSVGIPFSGHVPNDVGVQRAIDFGYASIDHLDGYVNGLVPEGTDPYAGGLFGYDYTNIADQAKIDHFVEETKKKGIWIVPTQSLLTRWLSPKTGAEMANAPEMKYIKPATLYQWRISKQQIIDTPGYHPDTAALFIAMREKFLKSMHEKGVNLLLGSDAPQILNVPGFSIQHEMQAMADAGIPNYAILKSGTANPAQFFNQGGEYGTVIEGASADLILLDANPLENIKHMQQPAGVMVRGQWLSRETIDEKLKEIEDRYRN